MLNNFIFLFWNYLIMKIFIILYYKIIIVGKILKLRNNMNLNNIANTNSTNLVSPMSYQTGDSYNINTTGYGLSGDVLS